MDRRIVEELLDRQEGVVSCAQLLAGGASRKAVRCLVESGRLRPVFPGVYTDRRGSLTDRAKAWAGVLVAGEEAALGGTTALWSAGLLASPGDVLRVDVPSNRRVTPRTGLLLRVNGRLPHSLDIGSQPPRVRVEEALLDDLDLVRRPERVVDRLTTVLQRRGTTADRVRLSLRLRARHRWRRLVLDVCQDVTDGLHSRLEREWRDRVERPHRLPRGRRNVREVDGGATVFRDVLLQGEGMRDPAVVELDGQVAHPAQRAFRDRRRDNRVSVSGRRHLRYGWYEVTQSPCAVAEETGSLLVVAGWTGWVERCAPGCPVGVRPGAA